MGINFQASDDPGTLISFPDLILQKIYWLAVFLWLARNNFQQTKCEFQQGRLLNQGGNGTNSASDGLEGEAGYFQKVSLWETLVKLWRKTTKWVHLTALLYIINKGTIMTYRYDYMMTMILWCKYIPCYISKPYCLLLVSLQNIQPAHPDGKPSFNWMMYPIMTNEKWGCSCWNACPSASRCDETKSGFGFKQFIISHPYQNHLVIIWNHPIYVIFWVGWLVGSPNETNNVQRWFTGSKVLPFPGSPRVKVGSDIPVLWWSKSRWVWNRAH